MNDIDKTKEQLIKELSSWRQKASRLKTQNNEYKQSELKTRQKNEFLTNVFDSLTFPFYVINAHDYIIKFANSTAGPTIEIDKTRCFSFSHNIDYPCNSKEHSCPLEIVKKTKKPTIVEHIHFYENNIPKNVEVHAYPIFDEKGNVVQMIEYSLDITRRKQVEEELKESEKKLAFQASLLEQVHNAIIVIDFDNIIKYWNKHAEEIYQWTNKEAIGKNIINLLSPTGMKKQVYKNFEQLNKEGHWEGDFDVLKKDGTKIPVHIANTYWHDNKGTKIGYIGISKDITENKKAENIQNLLFNISSALKTSDDLKDFINLIKLQLGTVLDTTNFFIALYNKKTNKFSLPFFIDEKDKAPVEFPAGKTMTAYVLKTKKPLLADQFKIRQLERSGEIELIGAHSKVWLGVPLKIEEIITGVLVVQSYSDEQAFNESDMKLLSLVSEQVSIFIQRKSDVENLKIARKKAEESDRLKSAFLANMSHEIRTPMNAIIGFSNLIANADSEEQRNEFISIITKNGDNLLKIIDEIIDLSKIEAGVIEIENEESNLNRIFNDILDIYKIKDKVINKDIKLNLIKGLPDNRAIILSDNTRLSQVLINLVGNAYKFTKKGEIKFGYSIKQYTGNIEYLEFFVKDTGAGIKLTKQKEIFERFVQEDESTTRMFGGTGLGLSISKAIVNVMGGNMWVKSDPGKGSTFFFTIPFQNIDLNDVTSKPECGEIINWGNKTILIAEDMDDSYYVLENILRKTNVKLIRANNGREAVEIARKDKDIDLILMDVQMPIMNGYEATTLIKKFHPDLGIIAQTAYAIKGDKEKAITAGYDDYLTKPIYPKQLINKINDWFSKKNN